MKKFISILMLFALILSCCACAKKDAATTAPAATEPAQSNGNMVQNKAEMTPEELYGHIDQTQLIDGYYKLWNAEGLKQLVAHPEAKFQLLCNIDMEGATLAPIPEISGEIDGANFTIMNFTLQGGSEENFGFIGVNKGNVHNLYLENVTYVHGTNAKNIGALAGVNEGTLLRCYVKNATLPVTKTAEDAACGAFVGVNTGRLANVNGDIYMDYTAAETAFVGGLVGVAKGGTVQYLLNDGKLTVTGDNKTVGLFVGDATDTIFVNCIWRGEDNSQDGLLFTNFTGNADDDELVVAEDALWRDNGCIEPLPENVMKLRNKVVQAMYDLVTVEWRVKQDLVHSCTCQLSGCHGTYSENYTYIGMPYNHKSSSLARFTYCQNEDKTMADWFYDLPSLDGFDIYMGTDCSSSVQQAWWTVSNSTDTHNTTDIPAANGCGTIAVGDYVSDFKLTKEERDGVNTYYTAQYIEKTDFQVMMESYALMRPGDAIVNKVAAGGHTQMIATFPAIVRDQNGDINAEYSYVLVHEQGGTSNQANEPEGILSTCSVNDMLTFAVMYTDCYVPVTIEEFMTGEMEPVEAYLDGAVEGYSGMMTGRVHTNYHLDYVKLTIIDENGKEVLDHPQFTTTQKAADYGGLYFTGRMYTDWMDMCDFANILSVTQLETGMSYTYKVTACTATFDQIVVHEGEFTYG